MNVRVILGLALLFVPLCWSEALPLEQRNDVSYLRGPYNGASFHREEEAFRIGAAIHFAHGIQHDILQLEPLSDHRDTDARTDEKYLDMIRNPP